MATQEQLIDAINHLQLATQEVRAVQLGLSMNPGVDKSIRKAYKKLQKSVRLLTAEIQ